MDRGQGPPLELYELRSLCDAMFLTPPVVDGMAARVTAGEPRVQRSVSIWGIGSTPGAFRGLILLLAGTSDRGFGKKTDLQTSDEHKPTCTHINVI